MLKLGLLGEKLSHSFSPVIHEAYFRHYGIRAFYGLLETRKADLKNQVLTCKEEGYRGLNVTIPYKEAVMEVLDEISAEAKAMQAVNTLVFEEKKIIGHNTDGFGFERLLAKEQIDLCGKRVLILGTGGAAKGVSAKVLAQRPKALYFASRRHTSFLGFPALPYEKAILAEAEILIQTTPIGMFPYEDECPVAKEVIFQSCVCIDLIYNPRETLFLKTAQKAHKKSVNGLYLLVAQGLKSQEYWQGISYEEAVAHKIYGGL